MPRRIVIANVSSSSAFYRDIKSSVFPTKSPTSYLNLLDRSQSAWLDFLI